MENETSMVSSNEEEIKQSQALAGQTTGVQIPFVPILTVNNSSEKKTVDVEGVLTEVKIPAVKGFNKLTRQEESKEYSKELLKGDTYGTILKERYQIEKNYSPEDTGIQYKSDEFDDWNDNITLYNSRNRKEVVTSGTYKQLKELYTTIDEKEKKKKEFSLYLVLYVNHNVSGKIVRLKTKMNSDNKWFEYKKSFASNEPWAGYTTEFLLQENTIGEITYWYIGYRKGEQVNLTEQLELQREINKFFILANGAYSSDRSKPIDLEIPPMPEGGEEVLQVGEVRDESGIVEETINVEEIPF